jgi:molecular chaperone GrpE (heat shock protein)
MPAVGSADAAEGAAPEETEGFVEESPQEPEESPVADSRDGGEMASLGSEIIEKLEALHRDMVESAAVEQHQATLLQKLHAENVNLREGELTQALKPIILDLARLHDDVAGVIVRGGEELRKAAVIPELILDVLERHGVSQIKPNAGELFDGKQHQGLRGVPTSDRSLDGTIESVIRLGFLRDGEHLVRPAQVAVYRHTQPEAELTPDSRGNTEPNDVETSDSKTTANPEQPGGGQLG